MDRKRLDTPTAAQVGHAERKSVGVLQECPDRAVARLAAPTEGVLAGQAYMFCVQPRIGFVKRQSKVQSVVEANIRTTRTDHKCTGTVHCSVNRNDISTFHWRITNIEQTELTAGFNRDTFACDPTQKNSRYLDLLYSSKALDRKMTRCDKDTG